jgi:hypothetical protein
METFRPYHGGDKHGNTFPVFQYCCKDHKFLNVDTPKSFMPRLSKPKEMPRLVALYIAEAAKNRSYVLKKRDEIFAKYVFPILFFYLAEDQLKRENTPDSARLFLTFIDGDREIYYRQINDSFGALIQDTCRLIASSHLYSFSDFFEKEGATPLWHAPTQEAVDYLENAFPDIYATIMS